MALTWNFKQGTPMEDFAPQSDPWFHEAAVNSAVIFGTMALGIGNIRDEDEAREFYDRHAVLSAHLDTEPDFTLDDVVRRIGLETNVYPRESRYAWDKRMRERFDLR